MLYCEWLKDQMEEQGITQGDVSILSGVSGEMVASLCQGRRLPSFSTAINICAALEVSLEDAAKCDEFLLGERSDNYHQKKGKAKHGKKNNSRVQEPTLHRPAKHRQGKAAKQLHTKRTTVRVGGGATPVDTGLASGHLLAGRSNVHADAANHESPAASQH